MFQTYSSCLTKGFYYMNSARECVAAVEKRLNNKNPNVQLYAIAVSNIKGSQCLYSN
jgi:hypothetical protein